MGNTTPTAARFAPDSAVYRLWADIHPDFRTIHDGARFVLAMDLESGATVLAPWNGPAALAAHDIGVTVTRSHGERLERVALTCSCGVKIPAYRRTHAGDSPVRDAAGFPAMTGDQLREVRAHIAQAHARAGVSW